MFNINIFGSFPESVSYIAISRIHIAVSRTRFLYCRFQNPVPILPFRESVSYIVVSRIRFLYLLSFSKSSSYIAISRIRFLYYRFQNPFSILTFSESVSYTAVSRIRFLLRTSATINFIISLIDFYFGY